MNNEVSSYQVKTENVKIGVPADLKDKVLAAVQEYMPTLQTEKKGEVPTDFGMVAIPGTESWILVHAGRLKRPVLELVAAFASGVIAASALPTE